MLSNRSADERRPLLTVEQFAAALALNPKTVRNKIYLGDIPVVRIFGRSLRIRPEVLDDVIAGRNPRAHTRAPRATRPATLQSDTAPLRRSSGGAR